MRTSTARALHLVLFGLGLLLYVVFVLPRWWVLTGDIPRSLATAGRIATGIPIALAALPVMQLLQAGLRTTPRPPELALRLRAWSGVLHVVAGVLILLAAIAEIWLRLEVGAPWLFGVYGAAGAIAILGFLALYLSFVAAQPPGAPKLPKAKAKKAKAQKRPVGKKSRGKQQAAVAPGQARTEAVADNDAANETDTVVETETVVLESSDAADEAQDTAAVVVTESTVVTESAAEPVLRNKRPAGKSRRRLTK